MATVYSALFIAVSGLSGAQAYTVPDGFTAVVHTVDAYTGNGIPGGTCRFQDNDTGGTIWYFDPTPDVASYGSWRGRQVFEEGQTFQVSTANQLFDIRVCGYLLTNP